MKPDARMLGLRNRFLPVAKTNAPRLLTMSVIGAEWKWLAGGQHGAIDPIRKLSREKR
jgi:hypothetical protein